MKENEILARVRLIASRLGLILFRNNSGSFQDRMGRWISFGVGNPGGSDLIGWHEHVIKAHDVGRKVAIFTAIETKSERGQPTEEQENFLARVRAGGGISGIVRSESETMQLVEDWRRVRP